MRHYKKGRKLGTDASHTRAMKKSLVANIFLNDRIKTTLERAKEIRGDVDRVITWAKRGDVHSRRLAIAKLGDKDLVAEIFAKVAQGMFEGRQGGYTRILRLGKRRGDSAVIVIMELVLEPVAKKATKADDAATAKPANKKAKAAEKKTDATVAKETETVEEATDAVADDAAEVIEAEVVETAEAEAEVADGAATSETDADETAAAIKTETAETAETEDSTKATAEIEDSIETTESAETVETGNEADDTETKEEDNKSTDEEKSE